MTIRPVRPHDLPVLAALWNEKQTLMSAAHSRTAALTDVTSWLLEAQRWIDDPSIAFFAAEREDRVVGYCAGVLIPLLPGISLNAVGAITQIALDAHGYHGGAGRALVEALRTWFNENGAPRVMVMVPRFYAPEQAFWRALGAAIEVDVMWLK